MMNIMSCVISYMLISLVTVIRLKYEWLLLVSNNPLTNSFFALLFGTASAFILSIIFTSKIFTKISVNVFHKTMHEDIWRDVLDLRNGSNIKIYLKDKDYYVIGQHKNHEEKGNESWLAVSAFAKFDKETNSIYHEEPSYLDDESVIYTIRFSDIEHIEIF